MKGMLKAPAVGPGPLFREHEWTFRLGVPGEFTRKGGSRMQFLGAPWCFFLVFLVLNLYRSNASLYQARRICWITSWATRSPNSAGM